MCAAGVKLTHNAEITERTELNVGVLRGGEAADSPAAAPSPARVEKPKARGGPRRMPKRRPKK